MLATQLGFVGQQTVAFRIMSAQVWHIIPNGELNNTVRVRFFSLINLTTSCELVRVLATLDDYGTPARNATVKFVWPLTHSSNVLASSSENNVMRITLGASQQVLLHIRVLWRGIGGSTTLTTFDRGRFIVSPDPLHVLLHQDEGDDEDFLDRISDLSIVGTPPE